MSSKSFILDALKSCALEGHNMPAIDVAPRLDDLIGQFETNLGTVAGKLHKRGGFSELQQQVDALIAEGKQIISQVEGVSGNREVPEDSHDLRDIDYAVIKGQVGVAENGAIWVSQKSLSHRITPFICENLFLVLEADAIVANMHEAADKIMLDSGEFGVFIAGPSKTADIEQALVVGAHGACSLNVFLI
ncbi:MULTISPECIES: LutC/YkgG family protein [Shewanella]|jgi:L-lactate dehydrogenase complex protein LldG|uniref:L-lactate dehydrogenase complex protein LldG n=1 Tax=Shewanella chilikensis TaxID=558541 RepID=A0A6G7LQB0_9GAMM|nr:MULTISPECIES: LUD domain-containing protein [Shewanella]MCA0952239.1 LUD domain-containing protein [Shewanella chilikensis]MCE9852209.1 LUD domain-containing protein [Shewanella chilikensis]MCL1152506.1 LUD domain-containing protein [Shewanella chilikensis]PYE59168.1 L-lactate dehydrogenase complex protein LldG [Shewanella chilikensis]QIJ03949.1 lactate utilization protein B/C [Shewanella chilikensis]